MASRRVAWTASDAVAVSIRNLRRFGSPSASMVVGVAAVPLLVQSRRRSGYDGSEEVEGEMRAQLVEIGGQAGFDVMSIRLLAQVGRHDGRGNMVGAADRACATAYQWDHGPRP